MANPLVRAPLARPPNVHGEARDVGSPRPAPSAWIGRCQGPQRFLCPDHVDL